VKRAVLTAFIWLAAIAATRAWEIADFSADIQIKPDSSLEITESIVADFTGESRHGIYRTIPVTYRDKYGNALALRLTVTEVTDADAHPYQFVETRERRYRKLRIGSPDSTVTGQKVYRIRYHVERAVTFFEDHDELYWNVTGNEWPEPIRRAAVTVHLPAAAGANKLSALAFTGAYGATTGDAAIKTDEQAFHYQTRRGLGSLEGLTIVAGWPKGIVTPPSLSQRLNWFVADNWPLGLPLLTGLVLTLWWYLFGRDPRGRGTVVVQYQPPDGLTPAEIGTVLDERCDMRDISATIIDLAARGYLRIKEIKREGILRDSVDYQFIKEKEFRHDPALKTHEKLVLGGIFGIASEYKTLSTLEGEFYSELREIRDAVYNSVVDEGYFPMDPRTVRLSYGMLGGAIIVLGVIGTVLQLIGAQSGHNFPWTTAAALGVGASGIVILLFARILPRKTPAGSKMHENILGLEEYLSRAESQELAAAEQQSLFERLLPYAVALGVTQLWAKRFENLSLQPPTWYHGEYPTAFYPTDFAARMGIMSSSMNRSLATAPRSTGIGSGGFDGSSWSGGGSGFGGGFSGGGGGGGGGGAW
jgi:uncharacterized membrane protein